MVCAVTRLVVAQTTPDLTTRRQLVERALAARDTGDHSGALELFLQAARIQMRPGLRMSIAQEQEALGQVLAACESASQCVVDVQADLSSPESPRVMQGCAGLVASACAALGRVQVHVVPPAPAWLRVEVQGRVADIANGAVSVYVDPGEVTVRATLGGREVFSHSVSVQRGVTSNVNVDVAPRASAVRVPIAATPSTPVVAAALHVATPHPASAPTEAPPPAITSRWWFWTGLSVLVLGGTVAGLAAGGVFDTKAPPVGGTAYTVEALSAR
jgi:hypothetical protein